MTRRETTEFGGAARDMIHEPAAEPVADTDAL
jgi:hypothetical protein